MTKKPGPAQRQKREYLEGRTHQKEDPPLSDDEIRRQLGFDLLPFNGGDREVQD